MGPDLIEAIPENNPHMALAVLWTPETLRNTEASMVGVGLVYRAPYIRPTSFCKAYFSLKSASNTEVTQRPPEAGLLFLCVSETSRVIPHAVERTLFLDVKNPSFITESNEPRSPQDFRGFKLHKVCLAGDGTVETQVAVPHLRSEVTYHTITYQRHMMPPEHRGSGVISAPLAEKDSAHWNLLNDLIFPDCLEKFRAEEEAPARPASLGVGDASDAAPVEATSVAQDPEVLKKPPLTPDQVAEMVDQTIAEINALKLQGVQEMAFVRKTDRALAGALMAEFTRLHLIVGEQFNTSLRNLQSELEAGTKEFVRDLDIACHHTSGEVSTENPMRVALDRFHTWARLKVALPMAQLDVARDNMEKFLISRVTEMSRRAETQSLLESLARRAESSQARAKLLSRQEFLRDPDVSMRVLVGVAAQPTLEGNFYTGIFEGLIGGLSLNWSREGTLPTSTKQEVARMWATVVQRSTALTGPRDVGLEPAEGVPKVLHLDYEDDFNTRMVSEIPRVFSDPSSLHHLASSVLTPAGLPATTVPVATLVPFLPKKQVPQDEPMVVILDEDEPRQVSSPRTVKEEDEEVESDVEAGPTYQPSGEVEPEEPVPQSD